MKDLSSSFIFFEELGIADLCAAWTQRRLRFRSAKTLWAPAILQAMFNLAP